LAGKKCVAVKLARATVARPTAKKITMGRKRGMVRQGFFIETNNGRGGQKKAARWIPRG
jgi:hypothetical protein